MTDMYLKFCDGFIKYFNGAVVFALLQEIALSSIHPKKYTVPADEAYAFFIKAVTILWLTLSIP